MDGVAKILRVPGVLTAMREPGYQDGAAAPIGALLLACTALYLTPPTAVLGAVMLTGYLGGAVATHVRVGSPLLSHTLFPVYIGALAWVG